MEKEKQKNSKRKQSITLKKIKGHLGMELMKIMKNKDIKSLIKLRRN